MKDPSEKQFPPNFTISPGSKPRVSPGVQMPSPTLPELPSPDPIALEFNDQVVSTLEFDDKITKLTELISSQSTRIERLESSLNTLVDEVKKKSQIHVRRFHP